MTEATTAEIAAQMLREAAELVTGPRQASYGDAAHTYTAVGAYWTIYLVRLGWTLPGEEELRGLSPAEVCQMMALLKLARGLDPDSCTDAAGYAALAHACANG